MPLFDVRPVGPRLLVLCSVGTTLLLAGPVAAGPPTGRNVVSTRLLEARAEPPRGTPEAIIVLGTERRPTFPFVQSERRVRCTAVPKSHPRDAPRCRLEIVPPLGPQEVAIVVRPSSAPAADSPKRFSTVVRSDWKPTTVLRNQFRAVSFVSIPPLEAGDVSTTPVSIAEGSELVVSTGVQMPAWGIDSAPVDFIVSAKSQGASTELLRHRMDPVRNENDRRWIDHRVALDPLVGSDVQFEFRVRTADEDDSRPQLPVWGDPKIHAPAPPAADRPSVVLISLDTLRAQSLSTYGYEIETSPGLTALAKKGTLFTNAYSTFINTIGGHESMLTGIYNDGQWTVTMSAPTLAEVLRQAGFDTTAFTENVALAPELGYQRGFSFYSENKQAPLGDAKETFSRAAAWAKANAAQQFFLFIHTYAVHAPYDPSPPYSAMFGEDFHRLDTDANQRLYEREVRELDDALSDLIESLWAAIPPSRLLLIITSDHGEEFGEHDGQQHQQPYNEVLRVPLVIVWPGVVAADHRVPTVVSIADIVPTVSGLLGLPETAKIDGVSLAPLLAPSAGPFTREIVHATGLGHHDGQRRVVAATRDHKCISGSRDHETECFDLRTDPQEAEPEAPSEDPIYLGLMEAAQRYGARHGQRAQPALHPGEMKTTDETRRKNLRALGYVE